MPSLSATSVSASVQRITPAALLEQAITAFNDGRLNEALHYARTLRTHALQSAEAVYVEVLSLLAAGKMSRAARLLQQYEVILSANAGALALGRHAWGRYHLLQGNAERALPLLQDAAMTMPDNQACLLDVAEAAAKTSNHVAALHNFHRCLALAPGNATLVARVAETWRSLGDYSKASVWAQAAWGLEASAEHAVLLAETLALAGNTAETLRHVHHARKTYPLLAGLSYIEGECHRLAGHHGKAILCYEQALKQEPAHLAARVSLARVLERHQQLDKAEKQYRVLLQQQPQQYSYLLDIANIQQQHNHYRKAHATLDRAAVIAGDDHPDIRYSRGFIQLLEGNWKEGWDNYESRWQTSYLGQKYRRVTEPLNSPFWDGKASLQNKTVMVLCEQGAGDLLQFARYCQQLQEMGATVDILAPPFMEDICHTIPWVREVHTNYHHIPRHDYHVSLMSMPLLTGTTLETIPWPGAYLHAPRKRRRFSKKFTVGLSWAGDATNPYDHWRSMPFPALLPLIRRFPDVCFVSLQAGARGKEAKRWIDRGLLRDGASACETFGQTAAAVHAVDMVISVCTATAHLAGAMDKPTWLLLADYADWRWLGDDSTRTAWYPSMRLFRQREAGNWNAVIGEVAGMLERQLLL